MAKIPFRLASIAVVCVTLVGASTGGGKLLDEPPVWYEKDNNDIPKPKQRKPSRAGDVWKEGVRAPLGRLTHPGRNVRRIGSFFGGEEVQQAANVNSLDEVPNSTWFTSRIGLFPMTPEQVISDALVSLGYKTQRSQARVLGEDPSCYSRYLKGNRSPQCSKVDGWPERLKGNGITIVLAWDASGCVVRKVRKRKQVA